MSYRDWHVDMKLVCIDNSGWEHILEVNRIYTLSAIGPALGQMYVGLRETPSPAGNDLHWRASRFRPVQKRKSDISVFTAMLNPVKKRERA